MTLMLDAFKVTLVVPSDPPPSDTLIGLLTIRLPVTFNCRVGTAPGEVTVEIPLTPSTVPIVNDDPLVNWKSSWNVPASVPTELLAVANWTLPLTLLASRLLAVITADPL